MEKVFFLSLPRTGTRGAARLMQMMGYRGLHWPFKVGGADISSQVAGHEDDHDHVLKLLMPAIEKFDSFADLPFPVLYREIHAAVPDARFVLMHRSPRAWLRALAGQTGDRPFGPMERVLYWHYMKDKPAGLKDLSRNRLMAMQARHTAEVIEYFEAKDPKRLAVISMDEPGAGERLQLLLGYPALFPLATGKSEEETAAAAKQLDARVRQSRGLIDRAAFAVGRAPGNPAYRRHHARLLDRADRKDEAEAERAKARELDAAFKERQARASAAGEGQGAKAAPAANKAKAPAKA